jgi:hypothetical protein
VACAKSGIAPAEDAQVTLCVAAETDGEVEYVASSAPARSTATGVVPCGAQSTTVCRPMKFVGPGSDARIDVPAVTAGCGNEIVAAPAVTVAVL